MSSLRIIQDRNDKRSEAALEAQQREDDARFVRALALAAQRGEFPRQEKRAA